MSTDYDKENLNSAESAAPAEDLLTAAVKSAILDRLLEDLGSHAGFAAPRSRYTKSDSGLYGKYEKQDGLDEQLLDALRSVLQTIVLEAEVETHTSASTCPQENDL